MPDAVNLTARRSPSPALICAITALPQIGVAVTLPSLPALRANFDAPVEAVQYTISVYFLCLALAQLGYGALSDRMGRRPLILGALALYGFAGLACAFAADLPGLVFMRAIQGVGAAGCMVLTRAIVGDAFHGQAALRTMSVVMLAPSLISLIGPLTGGWLLAHLGWHGVFAVIAAAGLTAGAVALFFLPETIASRDRSATNLSQMLRNIVLFASTPKAVTFAAITSLGAAGIYAYSATSSFVLIEVFGVSSGRYGLFLALTGSAMMAGNWCGGRIPAGALRTVLTITALLALGAGVGVLLACLYPMKGAAGIASIMTPMVVYGFAVGLFSPFTSTTVVKAVPGIGGMSSAVLGTLFMSVGALFVWLGGRLYDGTPAALGICVAIAAGLWPPLYLAVGRRWI